MDFRLNDRRKYEPWSVERTGLCLFGFGTHVGALGVKNTGIFGPEVGILGLAVNLIFALALWQWWESRGGGVASIE